MLENIGTRDSILIHDWMIEELELGGTELLIYAVIHGFSKDGVHWYTGSQAYLRKWCGASTNTVQRKLNDLVAKGLLIKEEYWINNVKLCKYQATIPLECPSDELEGVTEPSEDTSQSNISKLFENAKKGNEGVESIPYEEIIKYLNEKTNKRFSPKGADTVKCIKARWNEGYTLDDFKKVIDNKCASWLNDEKMASYLRPSTLFSNKFESYLNETPIKPKKLSYETDMSKEAEEEWLEQRRQKRKSGRISNR